MNALDLKMKLEDFTEEYGQGYGSGYEDGFKEGFKEGYDLCKKDLLRSIKNVYGMEDEENGKA